MKKLKLLLRFLVTVSLVFYLSTKIELKSLFEIIGKANLPLFLLSSLLYILSSFLSTLRWQILISRGADIKKSTLFSLYMIGAFFNQFLPGIMGGDFVKVYYLRKLIGLKDAAISVFFDRYIGFSALLTLGFLFFCILWWKMQTNWLIFLVPLMFLMLLLISLLAFKLGRLPILKELKYFILGFTSRELLIAFLYSLLIQSTVVLSVYLIFLCLNIKVNFLELFVYLAVIITLTTLPISISGIGVREWAFMVFFGSSIGNENSVAVSLLWFFSVVLASAYGGIEYLRFKDSVYMKYEKKSL